MPKVAQEVAGKGVAEVERESVIVVTKWFRLWGPVWESETVGQYVGSMSELPFYGSHIDP